MTHTHEQWNRRDMDFEQLVDQHYAPIYRFAFSLCGNESDAGDFVQQTFYLLVTKGRQIEDPSKVKGWLFTTVYRLFLAQRRRVIRFPHQEVGAVEEELPEVPPELPARMDWQVATECLAELDETFRAPVALFYLEDYSYREIAVLLEAPLGTVKSRIARGIGQMQKRMTDRAGRGAKTQ